MDAEKKQRKTEARRISEAMRDLMNVFRTRFEEEFRASGVTLAQLRLLKAVQQQDKRSAASIARECHVAPQTLHTMLARAVREGEALLAQGMRLREQAEAEMWRDVPAKAVRQARRTLEAGLANLQGRSTDTEED